MTLQKICRPLYKIGSAMVTLGLLATATGIALGLLGKGWDALFVGAGLLVAGVIVGQIGEGYLTGRLKFFDPSLTPKQAHDLAVSHLRERGDNLDDTAVFLGKFVGELEYRERQKRKQSTTKSEKY